MKKVLASLIVIGLLAIAAGSTQLSAAPLGPTFSYHFDFNRGLGTWGPAGDIGKLGKKTLSLETDNNGSPTPVPVGNNYAALNMNGGAGSSAVWMLTTVPDTGNTINVTFNVKAVVECGRCVAIAYVGRQLPPDIGHFQKIGVPLGEENGWAKRTFDAVLPLEQDVSAGESPSEDIEPGAGTGIVIAIGYMNLDSVKEFERVGLDDVEIRVSGPGN